MSINTQTNWTLVLFATIAVLWGTSFMAIEVGFDALPPVLFTALRCDVAGIVLFGYGLLVAEDWWPRGRDEWLVAFVGGALLTGAHLLLLFSDQRYVMSGVSAIVISLVPVLTPPFAWPMLPGKRLDAPGFLGVLLGLAGTVVIALTSGSIGGQLFGVLLLFLAAAAWAFGSILVKRPSGNPPVIPMQLWMMSIGAAMLHVTSPVFGEPGLASVVWVPIVVAALLLLVVLCGAVGFTACFVLLGRIGAVEISLVNYVTPAIATVTGWTFLGECLGPATAAGFALILVSFALMKRDVLSPLGRRFGVRVGLAAPVPVASPDGLPADD